ncbi:hypothetical protein RchiOBHm_Chr7g0213591 [Rosa chinensis]|uniref:Uncharacterized protein n=1 Tax=Rosa chinensis TaxID=74649 RepID=A0A2P6PB21_ROSCH|nr:hypothetical protein RchiOBHm_Chr7g0213591 [Rosa chinensis]
MFADKASHGRRSSNPRSISTLLRDYSPPTPSTLWRRKKTNFLMDYSLYKNPSVMLSSMNLSLCGSLSLSLSLSLYEEVLVRMEKKKYPIGSEHYTLYMEVGQGVSASVHRAVCKPFNEDVAIQILDFERDNCDLVPNSMLFFIF